jgi:hypothetical protein
MLPFRATGWKLNGKELPDGSVQRGNIIRFDAWDAVLDSINRMVLSKTRRVLVIDDFQVVMQHENMMRAYQTGYQKFTEMADHVWQIIMAAPAAGRLQGLLPGPYRRVGWENQDENHRQDVERKAYA